MWTAIGNQLAAFPLAGYLDTPYTPPVPVTPPGNAYSVTGRALFIKRTYVLKAAPGAYAINGAGANLFKGGTGAAVSDIQYYLRRKAKR